MVVPAKQRSAYERVAFEVERRRRELAAPLRGLAVAPRRGVRDLEAKVSGIWDHNPRLASLRHDVQPQAGMATHHGIEGGADEVGVAVAFSQLKCQLQLRFDGAPGGSVGQ